MSAVVQPALVGTHVVAKALLNVKAELGLSAAVLGQIIGMDASSISRMGKSGDMKEGKPYEAALLVIRVYRSLYALLGGTQPAMVHWLTTGNQDFQGEPPLQRMVSWVGLVEVVQYLDAMRGRV